jgi:hypothetical protein
MANGHDHPEEFLETPEMPYHDPGLLPVPAVVHLTEADRIKAVIRVNESLVENRGPLMALVIWKNVESLAKLAVTMLTEPALGEVEGRETMVMGAKVAVKRSRAYEYGNDSVLTQLEEEKKLLEEDIKTRKRFLEALRGPMIDANTGEEVLPAIQTKDGQTIAVTLPK